MGLLDYVKTAGADENVGATETARALAYIRVSHEDSADRATSLETQRRDIRAYADREGIDILESFEEPGKSAFKDSGKRPEFQRMIRHANDDPRVSMILVWKSDRFSRDRYQAAGVKGELAKAGVRVLAVTEPYDSRTTSGIVMESVTDAMNQIRSMEIGLVTHRSLLVNCEMRDPATGWAYKNGGMAQFGYRNERVYADVDRKYQRISHCIWVVDDETVAGKPIHEWARTILVDWRLKEKVGPDVIAKRLTQAGVPTPRGRRAWSDSSVNYLMMPDKLLQYAGLGIWNRRDFRAGGKSWKDRSEWKIVENAHPAIITMEEAEAIHAIREQRASRPGRRGKRPCPHLLSGGLLICSGCGANYAGRTKHGDDYYVCGSHIYRDGADCDKPWYIRREDADSAAFDCIQLILSNDHEHTRRIVHDYNKWVDSQTALYGSTENARKDEICRLEEEIKNLTQSLAAGVDPVTVRTAINERAQHIEKLQSLGDAELPSKITARDLDTQAAEVRKIAESRDPDRKRAIIRKYIAAMKALPEERTVVVSVRSLSSLCGHSLVGHFPSHRTCQGFSRSDNRPSASHATTVQGGSDGDVIILDHVPIAFFDPKF